MGFIIYTYKYGIKIFTSYLHHYWMKLPTLDKRNFGLRRCYGTHGDDWFN